MTYNAANRKDIRLAEKAQLIEGTITREVIAGLMSVANGRHYVYDRLADANVFTDSFSPDPYVHAHQAGLRASGIALFNDLILYAPDNFVLMLKEAHERSVTESARRANARRAEPDPDDVDGTDSEADAA